MPNINAKEAGDNFFPQYNVVTKCLVGAIAIVKGRLYTKDVNNHLVVPTATGFINGLYQATTSIPVAGAAGANTVQCYGPRSRVGVVVKDENMHGGQLTSYVVASGNVQAFVTAGANAITKNEYANIVGRIFEIKSKENIEVIKDVTAAGDLVILEFGGAF